jgi:hypothetical protein
MNVQYLDLDVYRGVTKDVLDAAVMVDYFVEHKLPFLKKYDSYSCKGCDFIDSCKPWTTVGGFN